MPSGFFAVAVFALIFFPAEVSAQEIALSLGDDGSFSARTIQLFLLITVLSLAPGLAIMVTCFPFLVTVLSILRQAIGLQQSPPNMLLISLALFLTYFIMEPVFERAWINGIQPLTVNAIDPETAFTRAIEPFRVFMAARLDPETFYAMAELRDETLSSEPTPDAP
ncbi:MAG: flagellar biosynthetic protein FliP, partial [Lentilitoribacter sp.]